MGSDFLRGHTVGAGPGTQTGSSGCVSVSSLMQLYLWPMNPVFQQSWVQMVLSEGGTCVGGQLWFSWASLVAQTVKDLPAMWETQFRSLWWEDPLKKGMAKWLTLLILCTSFLCPAQECLQAWGTFKREWHCQGLCPHGVHSGWGRWKRIPSPNRSFHVGIKCYRNNLQTWIFVNVTKPLLTFKFCRGLV